MVKPMWFLTEVQNHKTTENRGLEVLNNLTGTYFINPGRTTSKLGCDLIPEAKAMQVTATIFVSCSTSSSSPSHVHHL